MNQWVVWFNIVSFTLMFAAFSFSFIGYLSGRTAWLRSYLLYFASYAFWLVLATYFYFRVTFIPGDHALLDLVVGYTRVAISMLIALAAPLMVAQLDKGRTSARQRALLSIMPTIILVGAVLYVQEPLPWIAVLLSLGFNGFMLAVSARGLAVLRRATPDPRVASLRAFFAMSIVLYALLVGFVVVVDLVISPVVPAGSTVVTGVFGLSWSLLVIVDQVRRTSRRGEEGQVLPAHFVREFHISSREASIVQLLADGRTSKEIGERLFVSPRTVETHARNIYRKCRVSNKVELVRLIESCRAR